MKMTTHIILETVLGVRRISTPGCSARLKPAPRHDYEISARTTIKLETLFLLLLDRLVHRDELRRRELLLELSQEQMVDGVRPNDPPWKMALVTSSATQEGATYFTGPSSFSFFFTASSMGDDASTHTSPLLSLMAVERAPTGNRLNRENGLSDHACLGSQNI